MRVNIYIEPAPPTPADRYSNFELSAIYPNGMGETVTKDSTNTPLSFDAGSSRLSTTFNFTWQNGTWRLKVSFIGQNFSGDKYYEPSEGQTTFTVFPNTSPSPSPAPVAIDVSIKGDGSIEPPTAPIINIGSFYRLTSPLVGSLSIYKSNVIFDGANQELICSSDARFGLQAIDVFNLTINNLSVRGNSWSTNYGIKLVNASNCVIANNTIKNIGSILAMNAIRYDGLYVEGGGSNNISGNLLENNIGSMFFYRTNSNLIFQNTIDALSNSWGCYTTGVFFNDAQNNKIYHNNIKSYVSEYASEAGIIDCKNIWDLGFPLGGNYWGDYHTRYPDAAEIDDWGIANIPYVIDFGNIDHYPLTEPYTSATYLLQTTPPILSLESPRDQAYNTSTVELTFSVNKATNWTGYSLDNQPPVTIVGNTSIANLTNGIHSFLLYANDTYGNLGTSTVNFTVALPDAEKERPSVWPLVAVGVVVGVFVLGLIVYAKKRRH